jgi:hypothetical protein
MRIKHAAIVFVLAASAALSALPGPARPESPQGKRRIATPTEQAAAPSVPSRYGLIHESSQNELERSLARTPHTTPASVRRRLEEFNVLKYAFVDPRTGAVSLLGEYDPRFETGPIPYMDMLADALRNPYPAFSLDYDSAAAASAPRVLDADMARVARDPAFGMAWMKRLVDPVIYAEAGLGPEESQLLAERLRQGFGIAPEEHAAYAAWVRAGKKGFASPAQFYQARLFMSKLLAGVGVPEPVGKGLMSILRALAEPSGETGLDIFVQLGNSEEYQEIRRKRTANEIDSDTAGALLVAAYAGPIMRGLGFPDAEVGSLVDRLRAGRVPQETVLEKINTRWDEMTKKALIGKLIHGFRFSGAYLSRMYSFEPVLSGVNLFGNPPDSPLMRAFFEADYVLKYITSAAPSALSSAAMTFHQFLADGAGREGGSGRLPRTGLNRYWIGPGRVEMESLGGAGGVRFASASLKILAEPIRNEGGDAAGDRSFKNALAQYAELLTSRYDEYATAFPSLHKMREAEKVIALARWLKARNAPVALAGPRPASRPVPDKVEGFWGLTYLVNPTGDTDTIVFWMQGGVSFDRKEGEAWVSVQPDAAAERDVLRQLAASTALAERASAAALGGDLEAARDLAEKSAQAMTGKIDFGTLPVPVPVPVEGAASGLPSAAEQASVSLAALEVVESNTQSLSQARSDMAAAEPGKSVNPEAYRLAVEASRAAEEKSGENLRKLNELLAAYRKAPVSLPDAAVIIAGLGGTGSSAGAIFSPPRSGAPSAAAGQQPAVAQDWPSRMAKWRSELEETEKKIATTRTALLRLNAAIQVDRKQYEQWEQDGDAAFDRCVSMAGEVAVDFGVGGLAGRYDTISELAKKLPGQPADIIEKYRHLAALATRMSQAKATNDLAGLAARENKTEAELYETLRDGVGQLAGLLQLDKTVPGKVWKYGSLASDLAYNLTELRLGWKAVTSLQENTEAQREAVKKLGEMMRQFVETKKDLRAKIEAEI